MDAFFAISGLLIAKSFVERGLVSDIVSRVLRIFPAIAVCVLISVFIIGQIFSSLPLSEYFQHNQTWKYLRNIYLPVKIEWVLPDVFSDHKHQAVNGSLWTLPIEIRCYIFCAALGVLGVFRNKTVTLVVTICLVLTSVYDWSFMPLLGGAERWLKPSGCFLLGVLAYQWRKSIPIHYILFIVSCILLLVCSKTIHFELLIFVPLAYAIYFVALGLPHVDLDRKLGDISYGVYIYAFPVQQMVKQVFPTTMSTFNWMLSTLIVFILAYASWRLVEKPMLAWKVPAMSLVSGWIDVFQERVKKTTDQYGIYLKERK